MDVIAVTTFSSFACTLTPVSKVAATILNANSFATRFFFISSSPLCLFYILQHMTCRKMSCRNFCQFRYMLSAYICTSSAPVLVWAALFRNGI